MNTVKSFTIYEEYYELITLLPEKEQGELLLRIVEYMFEDKEPELSKNQAKIFNNLRRPLDVSKKNSFKGFKGGAPLGNKNAEKTSQKQTENKQKTNQKQAHQDVNVIVNDNVNVNNNNLFNLIEQNFGRPLAPLEVQEIQSWLEESISEELVTYATKIAVCNNACSVKYISGILNGWKRKKIKTLREAQEEDKRFKERKHPSQTPEWFDRKVEKESVSEESQIELEEILKDFK